MSGVPSSPRILMLGYGNPGRQDDGLGPALIAQIDGMGLPNLTALENYQLNIEDAADVAAHDIVWFVDAARVGALPYEVRDLAPAMQIEFTSHLLRPETVLAISRDCYGASPPAFLLAIRGYAFEFREELTAAASANLDAALTMLKARIHGLGEAAS